MIREQIKKGRNKRHHANAAEDEEPVQKKERNNDLDDEYILISALTSTITHANSGASKHMTGYKDYMSTLVEKESHKKVYLCDDYQYPTKGVGEASY